MHLPAGTQYLCICPNESLLIDFYSAADTIFANFGIRIIIQPITFDACVDLIKAENDRNFIILLMTDIPAFRLKALSTFQNLFEKSPCNHKFDVIENIRQIYFTLLGSLNLALVFTGDRVLNTFGVQVAPNHPIIKSTLISTNIEPVPIEILNIQPIILDMSRCGLLEPVLYFVARDFGTCIAQVLLPGSNSWSVAYLIQCDDSGRNDLDMVKVCLVNEEKEVVDDKKTEKKDVSVLNNPNYPLCRAISVLLYDLQHLSPTLDVVTPLLKTVSDALAFATADNPEIFPDAEGLLQVKKKYSTLFSEITNQLIKIKDHRQEQLAGILKNLRRMINFLNIDVKVLAAQAQKPVTTSKWYEDARSYSNPESRNWGDTMKIRAKRLESEQKDGIITMPLLEPYLDLKWPRSMPAAQEHYPFPEFQEYAKAMTAKEQTLLNNKRFGV